MVGLWIGGDNIELPSSAKRSVCAIRVGGLDRYSITRTPTPYNRTSFSQSGPHPGLAVSVDDFKSMTYSRSAFATLFGWRNVLLQAKLAHSLAALSLYFINARQIRLLYSDDCVIFLN